MACNIYLMCLQRAQDIASFSKSTLSLSMLEMDQSRPFSSQSHSSQTRNSQLKFASLLSRTECLTFAEQWHFMPLSSFLPASQVLHSRRPVLGCLICEGCVLFLFWWSTSGLGWFYTATPFPSADFCICLTGLTSMEQWIWTPANREPWQEPLPKKKYLTFQLVSIFLHIFGISIQ